MRDWFGYVPVYLITVDASFCENSNDREFCRLIEHELYHIGVERDEDGEIIYSDMTGLPKHYLAGHDVEVFLVKPNAGELMSQLSVYWKLRRMRRLFLKLILLRVVETV